MLIPNLLKLSPLAKTLVKILVTITCNQPLPASMREYPGLPTRDKDGNLRDSNPDMGAYEYVEPALIDLEQFSGFCSVIVDLVY
jgi:hypothetical protein